MCNKNQIKITEITSGQLYTMLRLLSLQLKPIQNLYTCRHSEVILFLLLLYVAKVSITEDLVIRLSLYKRH